MHFMPGTGKWHVRSTSSVNALYNYIRNVWKWKKLALMMMEAVSTSETSINTYQTTRCKTHTTAIFSTCYFCRYHASMMFPDSTQTDYKRKTLIFRSCTASGGAKWRPPQHIAHTAHSHLFDIFVECKRKVNNMMDASVSRYSAVQMRCTWNVAYNEKWLDEAIAKGDALIVMISSETT
jgi:hypothetical protein